MAQSHYNYSNTFIDGQTAKASEVKSEFESVETGFDDLNAYVDSELATTNANVTTLENALDSLQAFKGTWSSLTGALSMPASVYHSNSYWILNTNLADVTAKEPGVDPEWNIVGRSPISLIASGAITAGDPVVVNSDGTVSTVTGSAFAYGAKAEYLDTGGDHGKYNRTLHIGGGKVLTVWADSSNGNYLTAAVGTYSGTTLTYDTPVASTAAVNTASVKEEIFDLFYDSVNDVVLGAYATSTTVKAVAITVSGTTPTFASFGTTIATLAGAITRLDVCHDQTNDKVVVIAQTGTDNQCEIGSISWNGSSFTGAGETTALSTSATTYQLIEYDAAAGICVAVFNNSSGVYAVTIDCSATTPTFGTSNQLMDQVLNVNGPAVVMYHTGLEKVLFFASYYGGTYYQPLTCYALNISGGEVVSSQFYEMPIAGNTSSLSLYAMMGKNNELIFSNFELSVYARAIHRLKINLDNIELIESVLVGDGSALETSPSNSSDVEYISTLDCCVASMIRYTYSFFFGDSNLGDGVAGIAKDSVADTESVTIRTSGEVDDNQSGLTPGCYYYVDETGAVTKDSAGCLLGYAISSTELVIMLGGK